MMRLTGRKQAKNTKKRVAFPRVKPYNITNEEVYLFQFVGFDVNRVFWSN